MAKVATVSRKKGNSGADTARNQTKDKGASKIRVCILQLKFVKFHEEMYI